MLACSRGPGAAQLWTGMDRAPSKQASRQIAAGRQAWAGCCAQHRAAYLTSLATCIPGLAVPAWRTPRQLPASPELRGCPDRAGSSSMWKLRTGAGRPTHAGRLLRADQLPGQQGRARTRADLALPPVPSPWPPNLDCTPGAAHLHQLLLCLEQGPLGRQAPRVLAAVAVPQHDLLAIPLHRPARAQAVNEQGLGCQGGCNDLTAGSATAASIAHRRSLPCTALHARRPSENTGQLTPQSPDREERHWLVPLALPPQGSPSCALHARRPSGQLPPSTYQGPGPP